jgi:hypothetical protein
VQSANRLYVLTRKEWQSLHFTETTTKPVIRAELAV